VEIVIELRLECILFSRPTYADGNDMDVNRFKRRYGAGDVGLLMQSDLVWKRGHFRF
jgi:hypothetical protein